MPPAKVAKTPSRVTRRSLRSKNQTLTETKERSTKGTKYGHPASSPWTSNGESELGSPPPIKKLDVVEYLRKERKKAKDIAEGRRKPSPPKPKSPEKSPPEEIPEESDEDVIELDFGNKPLAPERPKTWPVHDPPITDGKVPDGWNTDEPDLHENDVDGQIERCHVRIKEGIMPVIFEQRLKIYQELKEEREAMMAAEPGLDWDVVSRLHTLEAIKGNLEETGDALEHLPNVEGIMKAYRSGNLKWTPGLVTFWSKGQQLCEPKEFDADDFLQVNRQHNGVKGFWVEGENDSAHTLNAWILEESSDLKYQYELDIHVRIPDSTISQKFKFLDDTGASHMNLYQGDVDQVHLMDPTNPGAPGLGVRRSRTAGGDRYDPGVLLEASVQSDEGHLIIPWTRIQATVWDGIKRPNNIWRLSGAWWRQLIAATTIPDGVNRLYLCETRDAMDNHIPHFDRNIQAKPPPIIYNWPSQPPPAPQLPPPLSYETNWATAYRRRNTTIKYRSGGTQTDEALTSDQGVQTIDVPTSDQGTQTVKVSTSDVGVQKTTVLPPPLTFQSRPEPVIKSPGPVRPAPPPARVRPGRPPIPRPVPQPAPRQRERGRKRKAARDFFNNPAEFIRKRTRR